MEIRFSTYNNFGMLVVFQKKDKINNTNFPITLYGKGYIFVIDILGDIIKQQFRYFMKSVTMCLHFTLNFQQINIKIIHQVIFIECLSKLYTIFCGFIIWVSDHITLVFVLINLGRLYIFPLFVHFICKFWQLQ